MVLGRLMLKFLVAFLVGSSFYGELIVASDHDVLYADTTLNSSQVNLAHKSA